MMNGKVPFLKLPVLLGFVTLLSVALAQDQRIVPQSTRVQQTLTVSGTSNTVVITNGAHLSDLGSGTYEVSVSSDLNTNSGDPDFNVDKVVVWASTPGNPWGWYWVVEEGEPQTIIIPTPIMDVWAFLLDTDASDNTGTATVTFRPCCPPSDAGARTLEVSGESNTTLITAGAHMPLEGGTYQVSVVSNLNLGLGLPSFDLDKVVVWARSPGDPKGWYWLVEEGETSTITILDDATEVWAFLLDIDAWNNTGTATVTFSSVVPPTPTLSPTPPPACTGGAVDVVFAMDTSSSMSDEFSALCGRISDVVAELSERGLTVKYRVLGITQKRQCAAQAVKDLIPAGTVDHPEDWGPAVIDLSSHYAWEPGYARLIIPLSDEGPQDGEPELDPGPDRDVIDEAIATARRNQVIVSPVQGTAEGSAGDPAKVERLMRDLAAGTGGLYFRSTDPASDLADALVDLIGAASCTPVIASISPECNITPATVVTINGQNFLPDATVELRGLGDETWVSAANVTVVSDTQITFQVPASLTPGTYEVRVKNPGSPSAAVTIRIGEGTCPSACPDIPSTPYFTHYFRNVTIDGAPAPVGTIIEAFNPRGDLVGCFEVVIPGRYGYMRVYGEDTATSPPIPGMRIGEPVTFKVNGQCADTWPAPVLWIDDKGYHAVDLSSPCRPAQQISLHSGWNWFSINRMPTNPLVPAVLSSIDGQYDLVLGESGVYKPPPANPLFNTLVTILPGEGYMIHMIQEAQEPNVLLVDGPLVPHYTPIPLHSGWDWFGYLPEGALEVWTALASLTGQYDLVLGEDGMYRPPPANPIFNTLTYLEPGRGYIIRMRQPGLLVYPATGITRTQEAMRPTQPSQTCNISPTPYFTHYYGNVTVDGLSAPQGAVVEALNPRGDVVGCFKITTLGLYGYMRVYGEDTDASPPIPGMRAGEEVIFRVDGRLAVPEPSPVIWRDDKQIHEVHLSVTTFVDFLPLVVKK